MKLQNLLIFVSAAALFMTIGCSTSDEAERTDPAEQTQPPTQTQPHTEPDEQTQPETQTGEQPQTQTQPQTGQENTRTGQNRARQADRGQQQRAKMCPMQAEDTTATVQMRDDSVAVDFTTTADVADLRQRVEQMAERHNQHEPGGGMQQGQHGGMQQDTAQADGTQDTAQADGTQGTQADETEMRRRMQMMANTRAETEEVDDGMRLVLTPDDPANLDTLHQHMQQHVEAVGDHEGGCPMMMIMGDKPKPQQ